MRILSTARYGLGVPLENDGLLFVTRSLSQVFAQLDAFLQSCSLDLLGIGIPLFIVLLKILKNIHF